MKIAIIDYSGSGKSTLAKYLGNIYNLPVLYLDTVQFLPGWKGRDREESRCIVSDFMKQESWVIDGNYRAFLQKERMEQADKIIFLKFSVFSCLIRVCKRYFKYRHTHRESMTEGCNEKMDRQFLWDVVVGGRTGERGVDLNELGRCMEIR